MKKATKEKNTKKPKEENTKKKKPTLGLCMIVKNEEDCIGRCLNSVAGLFDEMVIVDTGSTDKTKEILKKYTDKVYDFEWIYDFSAARNFSFSKSTCDFIMWLDADDVIYKEDLEKLKEFKENLSLDVEAYRMYYSYIQDENDNAKILQVRVRVVRNDHINRWEGKIHEVIIMEKVVPILDITIHHKKGIIANPRRNVDIYERMEKAGEEFSCRDLFLYATELNGDHQEKKALQTINKLFEKKDEYFKNKYYFDMAVMLKFKIFGNQGASTELKKKILVNHLLHFSPTPDVCCEIGNMFNIEQNVYAAKFWFENALRIAQDMKSDNTEYNEFCPYCGLAYDHYYMGEVEKSLMYSRKALNIFPNYFSAKENHKIYLRALIESHNGKMINTEDVKQ